MDEAKGIYEKRDLPDFDRGYLIQTAEKLINTPSPVGYYAEIEPVLAELAGALGLKLERDRKHTSYLFVPGRSHAQTVMVGAHLDTLGLIVRGIDQDGMLRVRNLGGINFNNIEGETVCIHTQDGRCYSGLCICKYHSVHVFEEARTAPRDETTMRVLINEPVHSEAEVRALGIRHGDFISLTPHFTATREGFLKSRFLDDKLHAACILTLLKAMKESGETPCFDTLFAFPMYEEIGHGGAYVPPMVSEYLALDVAVIGPDHTGTEYSASICAKDRPTPYDSELTARLLALAKAHEIKANADVFYRYGSDASTAIMAGANLRAGLIGFGTFASHGMERTHIDGVMETLKLLAAYVLEGGVFDGGDALETARMLNAEQNALPLWQKSLSAVTQKALSTAMDGEKKLAGGSEAQSKKETAEKKAEASEKETGSASLDETEAAAEERAGEASWAEKAYERTKEEKAALAATPGTAVKTSGAANYEQKAALPVSLKNHRLSDIQLDRAWLLSCMQSLIGTDSPVSFDELIVPKLAAYAKELGLELRQDRKHTCYLEIPGRDNSHTVMTGAHLDTLGAMIRSIDPDGSLRVRPLGGVSFNSLDGESVRVYTRDGRIYTGLMTCQSHDTHVFDDARSLPRDENTMLIRLDERVSSREEVKALGIRHGDIVAFEPHFSVLENGYVISRFLDDKAGAAALLTALKWMKENGVRPRFRTLAAFSFYEEINHGGAYVPAEAEEFAAIDIGLIGPDYDGREEGVSICAKDKFSPYDRELTGRLIRLAEAGGLNYAVDVYYRYGSDAGAAVRAGADLAAALFGTPCYASHGVERMHVRGIEETARLLIGYLTLT